MMKKLLMGIVCALLLVGLITDASAHGWRRGCGYRYGGYGYSAYRPYYGGGYYSAYRPYYGGYSSGYGYPYGYSNYGYRGVGIGIGGYNGGFYGGYYGW